MDLTYEEKLSKLTDGDFYNFFKKIGVDPTYVNCGGHRSIQVIGLCHKGHNHSAVFDPLSCCVTCFSQCGKGFLFHNWVKQALDLTDPQEAKDIIEDWIDDRNINFDERTARAFKDYAEENTFHPEIVPILPGIGKQNEEELYRDFDTSTETLERLVWHTEEGIDVKQLQRFGVAYYPAHKTIILPHHNVNGEIVGVYERNFLPLRKKMKEQFPEAPKSWLAQFPRAKYAPLVKDKKFLQDDAIEENKKSSWSFSNIKNLYGLHLAKDAIAKTGKAIVFEGAKSVMLAHQFGYPYSVATHTFGINFNHISMLLACGAKEIILAFDKQYQVTLDGDKEWALYRKKTEDVAKAVKDYVDISRIIDYYEEGRAPLLGYKDAPIDKGRQVFDKLFSQRELLCLNKVDLIKRREAENGEEISRILDLISRPKIQRVEKPINLMPDGRELITEF